MNLKFLFFMHKAFVKNLKPMIFFFFKCLQNIFNLGKGPEVHSCIKNFKIKIYFFLI